MGLGSASLFFLLAGRRRLRLLEYQPDRRGYENRGRKDERLAGHRVGDLFSDARIFQEQRERAEDEHHRTLKAGVHDDAAAEEDEAEHAEEDQAAQAAGKVIGWIEVQR